MKVLFRINSTDSDMIDIVTVNSKKQELLWAVVHNDFLSDDQDIYDELMECGDIEVEIKYLRRNEF